MNCPKCDSRLKVTHRYGAGDKAGTQRLECSNPKCDLVATCTVIMENINPVYGEGAAALARKILKNTEIAGISD